MRRFLVTSPAFKGQAELVFKDDNTLCRIDVMETNMPAAIVRIFKEKAPVTIDEIEKAFKGTHATVIEDEFEVTWDMFWKAYNKKINKIRCMQLWDKMGKSMQVKAYFGVSEYDKFLKKESWRAKADPETYLRKQYWDNEYK